MQPQVPSTVQLVRAYGRIGLLGFGGPAAQTALLSRVVVEEQGWLDARRFADGLALCSVLPGPEAMQLAVWSGWRVAGARGAWIAGSLFVLPGAVLVWGLAVLYAHWGAMPASAPWLAALRCAVVCLVVSALVRLAPRVLLTWREVLLAGAASVWLWLSPSATAVPVALFAGAALASVWLPQSSEVPAPTPTDRSPQWRSLSLVAVAWLVPLLVVMYGWVAVWSPLQEVTLQEVTLLIAQLATVGFGGAYTMVAWFGDSAQHHGWLTARIVVDGLGLAETTPGPLVLVLPWYAFQAVPSHASVAYWLSVWVLFVPSALWVLAASHPWSLLRHHPKWQAAFAGLRAVSMAAIAVLGLQVAVPTFDHDWASVGICVLVCATMWWWPRLQSPLWVLALCLVARGGWGWLA